MNAAGNEVWELLTLPSISHCTCIDTTGTYKMKTLVAAARKCGSYNALNCISILISRKYSYNNNNKETTMVIYSCRYYSGLEINP